MGRTPVTPFDCVEQEGATRLLRLGARAGRSAALRVPVVLVPSLLQRWYILDLLPETSLARTLCAAGFDVFVIDWGELGEERFLTWDDVIGRLGRLRRRAMKLARVKTTAIVGYSQGATVAAIAAALAPETVAALVAIAGPIDFSAARAGALGPLTDKRWCSADLLADAGGVPAGAFRAVVAAMHPGATALSVLSALAHPVPATRESFLALERWANDTVPLPPEVLRVWLGRLYQDDALRRGALVVGGRRVDLRSLRAPTLVVTAARDTICPPAAATALLSLVGAREVAQLVVPGGHVSGIAGPGSAEALHRPLAAWLGGVLAEPPPACPSDALLR
jgi:polyhydroxyalkanoate synthase